MIELTPSQHQAITTSENLPLRVVDPTTAARYVLVPEVVYERARGMLELDESSEFLEGMLPHVMEVFGREGWNDPAMDIYNDLDPRISS
jgi:hypothetical protein